MDKETLKSVGQQLLWILLIVVLAVILFSLGLLVGYGLVGDGDSVWSILSPGKWQELIGKFTGK